MVGLSPPPTAAPPQGSALLPTSATILICPVSGAGCGKTCKTTFMAVAGAQWLCSQAPSLPQAGQAGVPWEAGCGEDSAHPSVWDSLSLKLEGMD